MGSGSLKLPQKPLPGGRNRPLGPGNEVPEQKQNESKRQARNTVKLGPETHSNLNPRAPNFSSRCGPTLSNSSNFVGLLLESITPRLDRGLPLRLADGAVGGLRAIEIDSAATLDDVFRPAACNLARPCSLACNLATRQPAQPYIQPANCSGLAGNLATRQLAQPYSLQLAAKKQA